MILYFGEQSIELEKFSYALNEVIVAVRSSQELFQKIKDEDNFVIVVIGMEVLLAEALALAEKIRLEFPDARVLLSRKRLDVDTLSKALRAGFAEVVSSEDTGSFVQSVKHIREVIKSTKIRQEPNNRDSARGKVIVVFSAKGGCGKTTLSINLATALSEIATGKVCLVDLDLQFGDVGVSMQTNSDKTISAAIPMGSNLDLLGTRSIVSNFDSKLDLLLAPSNPTDVEFISGELVEIILENLTLDYEFVVIDTPPAFTDFVLKSMELMDLCFLITTLEMPAIKNMKIVLQTLEALKIDQDLIRLVLNRADIDTGISSEEVVGLLGRGTDYKLRNEVNVSVATNQGVPIVRYSPKSKVSREIRKMAKETYNLFYPKRNLDKKTKKFFTRRKTSQ
jgi:pilus assembly protein CpaE